MRRALYILAVMIALLIPASSVSAAKTDTIIIDVTQDYKLSQEVLKKVNKERKKRGLTALKMDQTLTKHAITRAAELCVMVSFDSPHKRPNGKLNSGTYGVSYECAMEHLNGSLSADDIVENWMNSPAHRKGILLPEARSVGIACVRVGVNCNYTLEFSPRAVKKVQKLKTKKDYAIKVKALRKYLPKKAFTIERFDYRGMDGLGSKSIVRMTTGYSVTTYVVSLNNFKWKSSDPSIVSVSKDGQITSKKPGTVTITATYKSNPKIKLKMSYKVNENFITQ